MTTRGRHITTDDGWTIARDLYPAERAGELPGLDYLAALVRLRMIAPTAPCVVGLRRTDAGYPDVAVAVPLDPRVAEDWRQGNRTAAAEVAAMLESGYQQLMAAAARGEEV